MDKIYETRLNQGLSQAWNKGFGEPRDIEQRISLLSRRMSADAEVAHFHFDTIQAIARGPTRTPGAHLILVDCYRRGWGVAPDPAQALHHLDAAIADGSEIARWFLGRWLLEDAQLASVLPPDPERALEIFRDLALNAKDHSVMSLALGSAASYIATHRAIGEVSKDDCNLVDQYASDPKTITGLDHLHLALFYAGAATSNDYMGPEYRKSRDLLTAGARSRNDTTRTACNEQLRAWGIHPKTPPPLPSPHHVGDALKTAGLIGGLSLPLIAWSVIGLALLAVTVAINLFVLPIILVTAAIAWVVKRAFAR